MLKVLIAGDRVFDPDVFRERIENAISAVKFEISTLKFTFDEPLFRIDYSKPLPTGMILSDPAKGGVYPDCGVSEFYGAPYSLSGKLDDVEILIVHGAALPGEVIEQAKRLRAVISMRGGPVNVDRSALERRGIAFHQTEGKNAPAVAEFVLGCLIDFERGITTGVTRLRDGWWWIRGIDRPVARELRHKVFGFVGYGKIARSLRELLSGFSARVLAHDPYVDPATMRDEGVEPATLEEVVSKTDYVSLHARVKRGAPPLMNARLIGMMSRDAVLINSARGQLLDYGALLAALREGRIRGAVLDVLGTDVFESYRELISRPDVLVTPHIAGSSAETAERGYAMAIDILKRIVGEGG